MNVEKYRKNREVVTKVISQIQKDFKLYDEEISISNNQNQIYEELFDQIKPIVDRLLNLDSTRFFALLYSIDIDEAKVQEILFGEEEMDTASELTHLILERELLKVVSRIIYSTGQI